MHPTIFTVFFPLLARLALATPWPQEPSPTPSSVTKFVDFEDAPRPTSGSSDPFESLLSDIAGPIQSLLPVTDPLGDYHGLNWQGVDYAGTSKIFLSGVKPQSGTHVGVYFPLIGAEGLDGASVLAPSKPYTTFSLKSIYIGCVLDDVIDAPVVTAGTPVACQVAFIGFKEGSDEPHEIEASYATGDALAADVKKVTFTDSTLENVVRMKIVIFNNGNPAGSTKAALSALVMDNAEYVLYK